MVVELIVFETEASNVVDVVAYMFCKNVLSPFEPELELEGNETEVKGSSFFHTNEQRHSFMGEHNRTAPQSDQPDSHLAIKSHQLDAEAAAAAGGALFRSTALL